MASSRKRSRADAFGRLLSKSHSSDTTATDDNSCRSTAVVPKSSQGNPLDPVDALAQPSTTHAFIKCPLCETFSAKKFALGRGIAAHLHAVHTPWNPSKLTQKIARRKWERARRLEKTSSSLPAKTNGNICDSSSTASSRYKIRIPDVEAASLLPAPVPPSTLMGSDQAGFQPLRKYTPTEQEVHDWETRVLNIVQEIENQVFQFKTHYIPSALPEEKEKQLQPSSSSNQQLQNSNESLPNITDRSGQAMVSYKDSLPAFLQAAANGQFERLQQMIKQAKIKDANSANKKSANSEPATKTKNSAVNKQSIDQTKISSAFSELIEQRDRHGSLAEHWAAGGGHLACLKLLLASRRDVHQIDEEAVVVNEVYPSKRRRRRRDGKTALHYASRNGRLDCVKYLVEVEGMNLHEISGEGTTPFHMACYGGHLDVARYLQDRSKLDVQPKYKDHTQNQGKDIFESATLTSRSKNIRSVLAAEASNDWGCTAVHWVAMSISTDIDEVEKLCAYLQDDCGLDFGARQQQGHSALHKAAQRGNEHILRWIASEHCNLSSHRGALDLAAAPDDGGHRPSDIWRGMMNSRAAAANATKRLEGGLSVDQNSIRHDTVARWMESMGW